jgi:outer membrane protein TolC
MKNRSLLLSIVLLICSYLLQAQQRYELTVKEAVDLAFKNLIEVKNAQLDYQIQQAKNKEIAGQALPQVTGNVGMQHYLKLPSILFPDATSSAIYSILKDEGVSGTSGPITNVPAPTFRQVSFQRPWNLGIGASLTQLLFQPDVFVGLQARKTASEYSQATIEQVKERVKDSAYKRYYAILVAEKQAFFLDEGVKRLEKLYHDDSIMFKNGFAERLDLEKVQVQINNLRITQSLVQNAVQLSYSALKFSIGISQRDTVVLKEELTTEALKDGLLEESFTYEDRPEIRTLDIVKRLQQLDLKRQKLGYLPTVSLSGNYSVNAQGQKFITNSNTTWINSSFIGLNVAVPIFDGFQRKYKIYQTQLNLQKVENNIINVKKAIDFEQNLTRVSLKTALANLDLSERNVALAEKVYNTTKLKFEQGLGSSFEVLQADADWQTAQANYFNTLYNAITTKISYQYSLGKLQ